MKIIICGKGGSGKSTISTLTAKALQARGFNVVLIDADESNLGLHRLMGVAPPVVLMDNLGGKKSFKQKLNTGPAGSALIFKDKTTLDELPGECISKINGIKLVAIGKINNSGEGCACPMGILSKMILSQLVIGEKDIVIIDSSAGVEHFGRGIDANCDLILGVVDPTFESFMLAEKMSAMADNAKIDISFILNKVDDTVADLMASKIDQARVVAKIPQYDSLFKESLEGTELKTSVPDIESICMLIEARKRSFFPRREKI